jgi:hypothetical protein
MQVSQWKKAIQEHAQSVFEGKRGPKPAAEHKEPERLFSEIGKLMMKLDRLKKSGNSLAERGAAGSTLQMSRQS